MRAPGRVLEVSGLSKRFEPDRYAVEAVDLVAREREIVAVAGESGCGKTTLLRLVAGLEVPDAGVIRIRGEAMSGGGAWVPPEGRRVGLVFQDFALFPHMTARRNVEYGLGSHPRARRRERAGAMLERVGLGTLADRYPHQLSGGEQQRVALARALAPSPSLLLLDEPFSNLDAMLKRTLREETASLIRETGTTALLVAHDPADVRAVADRVAVLRNGVVVQEGTPAELSACPSHPYVAALFDPVARP